MGSSIATRGAQRALYLLIVAFALSAGLWLSIGEPDLLVTTTFLLLALFAILCALNPVWGFGASLLLLPFSYQFQIANLDLAIGEPFFIVAVAALLISALEKRTHLEIDSYGLPLVLFLLGLGISVALWPTETAFGILRKALAGVAAFAALKLTRPNPRDLHTITHCFMTSGLVVALIAILQVSTGSFGFDERFVQQRGLFEAIFSGQAFSGELAEVRMANSTFNHFNMAGAYLDLVYPFFLLQALKRAGSWLSLSLIVLGINATHSRGSLLALLASTAFLLFMLYRRPLSRWFSLLLYGALTLGVVLIAVALGVEETLSLYGPAGRFALWQASWESFGANPIFGNGLGRTVDLIEERIGVRYAAHNIYLQLLADAGIIGLFSFLLLVVVFFKHLRRVLRQAPATQWFALGWAGAMVAYLSHGLVDHALFQPAFTAFFFIALAVMSLASKERIRHGN